MPYQRAQLAQQAYAGLSFALFKTDEGVCYGVGENYANQLGDGTQQNQVFSVVEIVISDSSPIKSLTIGAQRAVAINSNGFMYQWGQVENSFNIPRPSRIGTAISSRDPFILSAADPWSKNSFTSIAATESGKVYEWGVLKIYNQDGTMEKIFRQAPRLYFDFEEQIRQLITYQDTYYILTSSNFYTAGSNLHWKLGRGNWSDHVPIISEVAMPSMFFGAAAVLINSYSTIVYKNNTIYQKIHYEEEQNNRDAFIQVTSSSFTPTIIHDGHFYYASITTDGSGILLWGLISANNVGTRDADAAKYKSIYVPFVTGGNVTRIVGLSACRAYLAVISNTAEAYLLGKVTNFYGWSIRPNSRFILYGTSVSRIFVTNTFVIAQYLNSTWSIHNETMKYFFPNTIFDSNVKTVECGHDHCVFLTDIGSIYTYGKDVFGSKFVDMPQKMKLDFIVCDFGVSYDYTIVHSCEGDFYHWGKLESNVPFVPFSKLEQPPGDLDLLIVDPPFFVSNVTGKIYAWSSPLFIQYSHLTYGDKNPAVPDVCKKAIDCSKIASIAVGDRYVQMLLQNATLLYWHSACSFKTLDFPVQSISTADTFSIVVAMNDSVYQWDHANNTLTNIPLPDSTYVASMSASPSRTILVLKNRDYTILWIVLGSMGGLALLVLFFAFLFLIGYCIYYKTKQAQVYKMLLDDEMSLKDQSMFTFNQQLYEIDFDQLEDFSEIASGGSGSMVFRASWKNEPVAVKLFKASEFMDQNDIVDFEKELTITNSLKHASIVSFYGACLRLPRVGMVMVCDIVFYFTMFAGILLSWFNGPLFVAARWKDILEAKDYMAYSNCKGHSIFACEANYSS